MSGFVIVINPRSLAGSQIDLPLDGFGLKFFLTDQLPKYLVQLLFACLYYNWWRHHSKTCNLCVDFKIGTFRQKVIKHFQLYNGF